MKAILYKEYGTPEVLKMAEIEKPLPKPHEILIRVHATSVNYGDITARNFKHLPREKFNMPLPLLFLSRMMFGIRKPKNPILGSEFSGTVEEVGENVTQFKPGDKVFGYRGQNMGCYAEYLCVPADSTVAPMPENVTFEQAAVLPMGSLTALKLLQKLDIQPGSRVLVVGASGSIGSAALQIAKNHFGAHVTGVCSTAGVEMVKSIGADRVIDYTREDFTRLNETWDIVFDVLGKSSFAKVKDSLAENGIIFYASFKMKHLWQMMRTRKAGKRVLCGLASDSQDDMNLIKEMIEQNKIRAAIAETFPLEKIVDAHRYAEAGFRKGHVAVITKRF